MTLSNLKYNVCILTLLLPPIVGCHGKNNRVDSAPKVTNGIDIQESEYPFVVKLTLKEQGYPDQICTGTFVSANTLISAGHCSIYNGNQLEISYKGLVPTVHVHPVFKAQSASGVNYGPNDIIVATFASEIAPAVTSISSSVAQAGQVATYVGYGANDLRDPQNSLGAGVKRKGNTTVQTIEASNGGMIITHGLLFGDGSVPAGQNVTSGHGDSGGPLFIGGKIAGIVHNGEALSSTEDRALNANLFFRSNLEFLHSLQSQGLATIPSLPNLSQAVDYGSKENTATAAATTGQPASSLPIVGQNTVKGACSVIRSDTDFTCNEGSTLLQCDKVHGIFDRGMTCTQVEDMFE